MLTCAREKEMDAKKMAPNIVILPAQQNKVVTGVSRPLKHTLILPNTQRRIAVPISTSQSRAIATVAPTSRKRQMNNVLVAPKPAKRSVHVESTDLKSITELLSDNTSRQPAAPRKRQNLNHLTTTERQERRMMMNRVAAQTARDRKKARSDRLEEAVKQLITETRYLRGRVADLEQKLSDANAVIARSGNSLPSPNVAMSGTPAVGMGIRGSTDMAAGCGAEQDFHQGDETTTSLDYTANHCQYTSPEFSSHEMLIQELAEVTDGIDLDELCNDLFEDGFPDFQDIETEPIDQNYHPTEKVQTETEYTKLNTCELPSPSQAQFSSESTCDSLMDSTYSYEYTTFDSDCFGESAIPADFLDYPHEYQFDESLVAL
ncbi:hypothetical protein FO519_003547 [Halicephalobus sp. NKZ332]|nr:hypothetical protein FO519_003547 [Halicephalobus sp. NKZ332]